MSENFRGITPINWRALVTEALRRRKAEKMTQKEHAALASVSIPTIVAFDRGERTLSLAKAFDILRVVGLVEEPAGEGSQEIFVQEAYSRWRTLTAQLPANSLGRFPHGWYRIDYALEGDLKEVEPMALLPMLNKAVVHHTGWPFFVQVKRAELAPYEIDGVLECWLKPGDAGIDRPFYDAAHCDFWRAAPEGRMLIMRGYQEDAQDTIQPGTIFDTTLPIWRLGEALLHANRLSQLLAREGSNITIHLRALYTGLTGRTLRPWGDPLGGLYMMGTQPARNDEALLEIKAPAAEIENKLAHFVFPMVKPLYDRFGDTSLSLERVNAQLERMRQNQFG
jgi:transcriptional regulator with XRE-family HTH domain